MVQSATPWLIVNRASGSYDAALVERIEQILGGGGCAPLRIADCRADDLDLAAAAIPQEVTHIIILGGDGTINSVLSGLKGWSGAVLPLPGGTANLLAKALHGDDDPLAIVQRFVEGALVPRRIDVVRGEGHLALAEVLAGPGALWADVREDMREGEIATTIERALDATGEAASGPLVRLSRPELGRAEGYPGIRLSVDPAGVRVQGYGGDGWIDFVRQGLAIIGRDFRDGPHEELGEHAELTLVMTDGSPVELMVDGERATAGASATFRLAQLDLDLLGPKV